MDVVMDVVMDSWTWSWTWSLLVHGRGLSTRRWQLTVDQ